MIKVAVMGHGTVGSGVVELIAMNQKQIASKLEEALEVKYILDLRDFPNLPYSQKFIKDFSLIESDKEIKVVAEVIGGINPAYDFSVRCLRSGKSVVTSNKELVAAKGDELMKIAKENGVNYFFEASVGGGIPIIRPMHRCMAANEITEFYGILNGTTNFILTKMVEEKMSFEQALTLAQQLGYAERNPEADVEGHDACRKMCILASLAFGNHFYPEYVFTQGISEIKLEDVALAGRAGYAIKLIGQAKAYENGYKVMVSPALVSNNCLLSQVKDVFNALLIKGNAVGDVFMYGRGAGKFPTASAVVADIIDAAKHNTFLKGFGWQASKGNCVIAQAELETAYFVRIKGLSEKALEVYPECNVISAENGECSFITGVLSNKTHENKMIKLELISAIRVLDI